MRFSLLFIFLFVSNSFATETFFIKSLSKNYDVRIEAEKNEYGILTGKTTFTIFKKHSQKTFQKFYFPETQVSLDDNEQPKIAKIKDSKYSSIYLEDFNFDGYEDLALPDGDNGGYHTTSWKVYLYDYRKKQFIYNKNFTKLAQGPFIGIFQIDYKNRIYKVFWKSGAGFHEIQRFKLIKGKPIKIYEYSENSMLGNGKVYITTKKLIKGKWKNWYRTEKEKN